MKRLSFLIQTFGIVTALLSVGFPPFQEVLSLTSSGRVRSTTELGYHFVLAKPTTPPSKFPGLSIQIQIDQERYFATAGFGLLVLGVSIYLSSKAKIREDRVRADELRNTANSSGRTEFISYEQALNEYAPRTNHPLKGVPFAGARFWGKIIDIALFRVAFEITLLPLFIAFDWYPPYESYPIAAYVGTGAAFLVFLTLIEAACLSLFGTTVGKLMFGIHVRSLKSSDLRYRTAVWRTLLSYSSGTWFLLLSPAFTLIPAFISFKKMRASRREAWWDFEADTTIVFRRIGAARRILCTLAGVCCFGLLLVSRELTKQAYRSDTRAWHSR